MRKQNERLVDNYYNGNNGMHHIHACRERVPGKDFIHKYLILPRKIEHRSPLENEWWKSDGEKDFHIAKTMALGTIDIYFRESLLERDEQKTSLLFSGRARDWLKGAGSKPKKLPCPIVFVSVKVSCLLVGLC